MFPYLTTGLKKVWAAITALQNSLANVQAGAVQFLDYSASTIITIPNELNQPTVVNAGLIIFTFSNTNTSSQATGIFVNGNKIWAISLLSDSNVTVALYFKGGESVYFDSSNLDVGCQAMYIPFAAN